ncbi:hypothetical protein CPB83DRAFT_795942, partial [Crepidotus variabilis]
MPPPQQIAQALKNAYPKPQVDAEWLEQCCAWVEEEKNLSPAIHFQEFYDNVKRQLIESDLRDSMQAGTGLANIARLSGKLPGPPILVQITAITEIGVSAFQLEQVRAAREERILAGIGDEEGEEDGDVEVEGEGPMPKYPRGTLHFQLSDGATVFEGMEYRPLPQILLGTTKLGYKIQLNGTKFSNGIAFLEPGTVSLVGGHSGEFEPYQLEIFKHGLYQRLGRPLPPAPDEAPGPVQVPNYAPPPARAPLRDISPAAPTRHDDDIDMEPRRRLPTKSSANQITLAPSTDEPRPVKPLPARQPRSSVDSSTGAIDTKSSPSYYFNGGASSSRPAENVGLSVAPTTRQQSLNLPSPAPFSSAKNGSFDFDLLDEFEHDENAPPKTSSSDKGKGRAISAPTANHMRPPTPVNDASSDYGMDDDAFLDPNFLENLDKIEKEAMEKVSKSKASAEQASSKPSSSSKTAEVIELDSSEDEDKENTFVPMRHVRQRTEDKIAAGSLRGRSPPASVRQSQKKKVVTAINLDDVIDLSDSD